MADSAIQFHEVLQNAFGPLDFLPIPDGQIHRLHVPGSLRGWYLFRVDGGTASGCFGSWKAGGSWRSHPVDPLCQSEGRRISLSPNAASCPL